MGEVNGFATLILIQVIVKVKGVGPVPYSWGLLGLPHQLVPYCENRIQEDLEKVKRFILILHNSIHRSKSNRHYNLVGL